MKLTHLHYTFISQCACMFSEKKDVVDLFSH